jgi:hypothetical protein
MVGGGGGGEKEDFGLRTSKLRPAAHLRTVSIHSAKCYRGGQRLEGDQEMISFRVDFAQ